MQKEVNVSVPIHALKSTRIEESEDGEAWVFEGIASTSDIDLFGDVVYPESFLKTIEFFQEKGKIYFDHDYAKKNEDWLSNHGFTKEEIINLKTPVGKPIEARITEDGLYLKGILNKKHPMSKILWEQYLHNDDAMFQDQLGLSIGAKYMGEPRREYDVKKGKYITYLPDLLLYEVSLTPEPVNPYTSTWASVLKSMIKDARERDENEKINYHTIEPDEIVFDPERNQLAIKSTVEGSDGVVHVFESYIDIKEDVRKAMAEDKREVTMEEETPEVDTEPTMEAEAGAEAPVEVPEESAPEEGGDMMDAGAEMADDVVAEEDAGGILDSLVEGAEESASAEPDVGEPQEDESQALILDKLDTLIDTMMTIADSLHQEVPSGEVPGENQVTTNQLMKSVNSALQSEEYQNVIKSIVEDVVSQQDHTVSLSQESTESFGRAIKSLFEGFEDRLVEKVVRKMTEETVVTQKSTYSQSRQSDVVSPGVAVDNSIEASDAPIEQETPQDVEIRKSIDGTHDKENDFDVDTLKSLTDKYLRIQGYGPDAAQRRAQLTVEAERQLNMGSYEFKQYVNKAYKQQKVS